MPAARTPVLPKVADVRGRVLVRLSAAKAPLRIGGVLELPHRMPRVVKPKTMIPRAAARVRRPADHPRSPPALHLPAAPAPPLPALREVLELAVAVELVAKKVSEADGPWPARRAISGNAASSTSNRPSSARFAARSAEVTPETRLAPDPLRARRTRGISLAIAAVVVLPFVAETSTQPSGRRRARRSSAPGSSAESPSGHRRPAAGSNEPRETRAARAAAIPTGKGLARSPEGA